MEDSGVQYVKVEIIAKLFGVTARRVQQLTQEGIIETHSTADGRRYDLIQTIKTYIQYLSDKAYGKSKSEKEAKLREQKLEAEIALKESQGELHRMKREIAAGKYIDIEEVQMDYNKFFVVFKKFSLSIPARLMSMVSDKVEPLEARKIEKAMNEEVKRVLNAFVVAGVTEPEAEKKDAAGG
ncbi:MAG: hypothetical protein PHV18_04355 [Lachnospiraceae bacterium]|nr:hypothetical protein [Lachnospiraceae bacterium]